MRRRHLLTASFLLVIIGLAGFSSSNFVTPVNAVAQLEILSHISYIDTLGWLNVVGEVQNIGDQTVKFVQISATFYDSSNTVVDTDFTFTTLSTLLHDRKSPFKITLIDSSQVSKVDHYSLSVSSFSTTVSIQESLQIVSHSSYFDTLGWFNIVGEIKNLATGGASYVMVIATCYDESGSVINEGFTFTNPHDIEADQKAPFEITILSGNQNQIANYELTVESSEYALIYASASEKFNLTLAVSGSGITSPSVGAHIYEEGSEVAVTASPASGWTFSHWMLDGVNVGSANPYSVTIDGNHSLTAIFTEVTQEPPVASFTYFPLDPQVNDSIAFDASGCSDADGTIVGYLWDFGDGETSSSQNPTHAYDQEGSYTVTLTVTDNDGLTDTSTASIAEVVIPEFPSYTLALAALTFVAVVGIIYKKKLKA